MYLLYFVELMKLFFLFQIALVEAAQSLSTEECFAFGLNRATLLCSSCDTLKEFNLELLE